MSISTCKGCGKEFAATGSLCPHCGTKAAGGFVQTGCVGLFILFVLVAAIGSTTTPQRGPDMAQSETVKEAVSSSVPDDKIEQKPINWELKAEGIGPYFVIGTRHTQIQIENLMNKIIGEKVCWKAPVYEVQRDGNGYRVQFKAEGLYCSAVAFVSGSDNADFIESLMENDVAVAVGTIQDVTMKTVIIKDAKLIKRQDMDLLRYRDEFLTKWRSFQNQPVIATMTEENFWQMESFEDKMIAVQVDAIEPYEFSTTPSCAKSFFGKTLDRLDVLMVVPLEHAEEFEKITNKSATVYGLYNLISR